MATGPMTRALMDIRQLVEAHKGGELTDRQLLERFVGQRDEAAFALLVRRHGPMVLGVCRRVLRHRHDAEDAFQAAFLVLARKAASVRWQDSAGGWLFQVAYHLALKMRATAERHRTRALPDVAGPDPGADRPDGELRAILDEELSRLPEKYRSALLLCHWEGKTRAEAARQLGWKEGAVKIRLERGRQLLRARLTRRGLALSGLLAGSLLAESAAPAALPADLVGATVASAKLFALGKLPAAAAAPSAAVLAEGVLRAMMMTRLKIAALLVLAVSVVSLGVGLWAHRAFAETPDEVAPPRQEAAREPQPQPQVQAAAAPAPASAPTLRVLLFASAPTREYQYVRTLMVREFDKKRIELSIYLQPLPGQAKRTGIVQDVPPDRMLTTFPDRLDTKNKDELYYNLANYDVIIAFDPDWSELSKEQVELVERWVSRQGGGLVVVAGPIHTLELARPGPAGIAPPATKLKPLLDLYPVVLKDVRLEKERNTAIPAALAFPNADPEMKFLKLDEENEKTGLLDAWNEFFKGEKGESVLRGFHGYYPVQKAKDNAVVVATFKDDTSTDKEVPYLVITPTYGKGRVVWLGSGETWRLRQYREVWHERFWTQLARYAASAGPAGFRKPGARAPEITPEQRDAIAKGLVWLARDQHRDGHWEGARGKEPVTATALAGMALLMQGSTIREGKYAEPIRKAVHWLLRRSQPNGLIGNPVLLGDSPAEAEKYMDWHGRALLFLASVYGDEEDGDDRRKLEDVLTRAVEFTVKAQTSGGGWGHLSHGLDKEKDDQADVAATVLQLQALRAARNAGIAVPKKALDAARTYLEKKIDPSTPAAITGLGALAPPEYNSPVAKKWLQAARKSAPALDPKGKRRADDDLKLYSFAQVAYLLGEEGHAKLLPESKPEERITWGEHRKKVFDYLLKTQNADGSWENDTGKVHATALFLAILQLDYGVVPIYQK